MKIRAEDSTPVIIGAGQVSEKNLPALLAQPPMGLAAEAARVALADTGAGPSLAQLIDTIAVVRLFSDSSNRPRLQHGFGRAENPPRALARRIGADPHTAIYGHVGGNTPQALLNEMAERIAHNAAGVVLLAGAEALSTMQTAVREGLQLQWQEADAGSLEDRGMGEPLTTPQEYAHGIGVPTQTYPLFENAIRGLRGTSVQQQLEIMGKLFKPFTKVAAHNPFAYFNVEYSAAELVKVTEKNRYIGFPYPKLLNARDAVNQGAALIVTSVGRARELQIDPGKLIYLHGCGEASDKLISQRKNLYSSPGIRISASKALEMAGKAVADMSHFDLYSCFPSAVEIACDELGIAHDDPRGLTVIGGLPFFGGPGNNYSMHAITSMVERLRACVREFGLVTANGGWLSKHACGIYSAQPTLGLWRRENPANYQRQIDKLPVPAFTEIAEGAASIETYTVVFGRSGPERAIVVGRLRADDRRFIANTPADAGVLASLVEQEGLGRPGNVSHSDGLNTFVPIV